LRDPDFPCRLPAPLHSYHLQRRLARRNFCILTTVLRSSIVEVTGWGIWCFTIKPTVTPAQPGIDDPGEYKLSGGKFLGPKPSQLTVALAVLLVYFGLRVVGIPDVCPLLDRTSFSLRLFLGGMMMMYGIMMGAVYFWRELNGGS
jgi:hypothetical protein